MWKINAKKLKWNMEKFLPKKRNRNRNCRPWCFILFKWYIVYGDWVSITVHNVHTLLWFYGNDMHTPDWLIRYRLSIQSATLIASNKSACNFSYIFILRPNKRLYGKLFFVKIILWDVELEIFDKNQMYLKWKTTFIPRNVKLCNMQ